MRGNFFLAPTGALGVSLSVCLSVCPSGTNLSKALNLHLSLVGLSQICPRSVSGQCQVSLGGLSVPTLSDQRSLKYFVLFVSAAVNSLSLHHCPHAFAIS